MENKERTYIAIDLKSFYASVECTERGLDPLDANLAVADEERTDKTIALAISPSLKAIGLKGRARLFEVKEKVREENIKREMLYGKALTGESTSAKELSENRSLKLSFITAKPRMALYMEYSRRIYNIYLSFVSPEDIHVYSIDEVFIDATDYLRLYNTEASSFAMKIILKILSETGITATAGIGTNLYLAKVAMDIMAKHIEADENGVRIAYLDETEYRKKLWEYKSLSDFWRIGGGTEGRLNRLGLFSMGDIARCSLKNESLLYREFGKNAELLIDHAWGYESCTMKDIKNYRAKAKSIGSSQLLTKPYTFEKAKIIVKEMADSLSLDLVSKELLAKDIAITVGYDRESLKNPSFNGKTSMDHYGRKIPVHSHGTVHTEDYTSSSHIIVEKALSLFSSIAEKDLLIRRISITAENVISESKKERWQPDLFTDREERRKEEERAKKEKILSLASLKIKEKYGKNSLIRAISLSDGATGKERNAQIGGHKA